MVKSGLESGINHKTKTCSVCGSMDVKELEAKFSSHLMCLNDSCRVIVC